MKVSRTVSKSALYQLISVLILLSPQFVAIINGFFLAVFDVNLPIGNITRIAIIIYCIPYFLLMRFSWKNYYFVLLAITVLLFGFWWAINDHFSILREIEQLLKLIYPVLIACVLLHHSRYFSKEILLHTLLIFGLIGSLSIFFSYFTGINVQAGRSYEFGINSFYIARNEISLTLISILPLYVYFFLNTRKIKYFIYTLFTIGAVILLGNKSAFLGVAITTLLFIPTLLMYGRKQIPWKIETRLFVLIFIVILVVIGAVVSYQIISSYPHMVNDFKNLLTKHPRELLLEVSKTHFSTRELANFIGEGFYSFGLAIQELHPSSHISGIGKLAENDLYDLWGAYGFIVGTLWLLPPVLLLIISIRRQIRHKTLLNYALFISITLLVMHSLIVGHMLMSPLVSSVLAIHYFLVFKPD